jgi:hypothetical protein
MSSVNSSTIMLHDSSIILGRKTESSEDRGLRTVVYVNGQNSGHNAEVGDRRREDTSVRTRGARNPLPRIIACSCGN